MSRRLQIPVFSLPRIVRAEFCTTPIIIHAFSMCSACMRPGRSFALPIGMVVGILFLCTGHASVQALGRDIVYTSLHGLAKHNADAGISIVQGCMADSLCGPLLPVGFAICFSIYQLFDKRSKSYSCLQGCMADGLCGPLSAGGSRDLLLHLQAVRQAQEARSRGRHQRPLPHLGRRGRDCLRPRAGIPGELAFQPCYRIHRGRERDKVEVREGQEHCIWGAVAVTVFGLVLGSLFESGRRPICSPSHCGSIENGFFGVQ